MKPMVSIARNFAHHWKVQFRLFFFDYTISLFSSCTYSARREEKRKKVWRGICRPAMNHTFILLRVVGFVTANFKDLYQRGKK